jgi:hypothetical protein
VSEIPDPTYERELIEAEAGPYMNGVPQYDDNREYCGANGKHMIQSNVSRPHTAYGKELRTSLEGRPGPN